MIVYNANKGQFVQDVRTGVIAAKQSCRGHSGRWFGRASSQADGTVFLIYEGGKVIERHVMSRK